MIYCLKWLHHHQTRFLLTDFSVHMCIDCWHTDCHFPQVLEKTCNSISRMTWKIYLFSLGSLYIFHLNTTKKKFQHHFIVQWRLMINQWISLSSNCPHAIIFFFLCVSTDFHLAFLYINPSPLATFSQFCFNLFVLL